ncbi:MAG: hypothetical protein AAF458_18605 [Pseudomonadota bacterium]
MKFSILVASMAVLASFATPVTAHGGTYGHRAGVHGHGAQTYEIRRECHGVGIRRHCHEVRVPVVRKVCHVHKVRPSGFGRVLRIRRHHCHTVTGSHHHPVRRPVQRAGTPNRTSVMVSRTPLLPVSSAANANTIIVKPIPGPGSRVVVTPVPRRPVTRAGGTFVRF